VKSDLNTQTKHFDHLIVRDLMEDVPPLETIDAEALVREALAKMCAKNYSQLPVIQNKICIGSITLESIVCRLRKRELKGNLGLNFMCWPVERFVDKNTRFVNPYDDILKHTEWMAEKGFVLVGSDQKLESIVTNFDLVGFFKNNVEVFLLLREVETSLRYMVSKCLEEDKLRAVLASLKREHGPSPSSINDLTLDELRQLVLVNWEEFRDSFLYRQRTDNQLQKIRDFRNRIFHFRTRITAPELTSIRKLRDNYINLANSLPDK